MYRVCFLLLLISCSLMALVREEIIEMSKIGLDPDVILAGLKKDKQFIPMDKKDILRMTRAGVDPGIIRYLEKRYRWYKRRYRRRGGLKRFHKQYAKRVAAWKKKQEARKKEEAATVQAGFVEEKIAPEVKKVEKKIVEPTPPPRSGLSEQEKREALNLYRNGVRFIREERYTDGLDNLLLFLKTGFDQTSQEYQLARYEIAMAYFASGQKQMGFLKGRTLLMEFTTGKQKQLQVYHFEKLFLNVSSIVTDYPDQKVLKSLFLKLSDYTPQNTKNTFLPKYNYYIGKYFLDLDQKRALKHLSKVTGNSELMPSVHYLKSTLYVYTKQYSLAVKELQELLKMDDLDAALGDIANLAIGRIYYELATRYLQGGGKDRQNGLALGEAALDAYRSVATDSPRLGAAFHEAAWSYYVMQDYNRALGQLHALHSPYLKDSYLPDKFILEAGIYIEICHYKYAEEAINTFKKQYHPLRKQLRKYLKKPVTYDQFQKNVQQRDHFLKPVLTRVISSPQFHRLYQEKKRLDREYQQFTKWYNTARYKALNKERVILTTALKEAELRFNLWLNSELKLIHRELMQLSLKADEIAFEIINAEKRTLQQQKRAITSGKRIKRGDIKLDRYRMRSGEIRFSYTGEYWLDELSGYRSELPAKCQ